VWAAENLLRGVPRDEVIHTLSAHGVPRDEADRQIDAVLASPAFTAARALSLRVRRLELIAAMHVRLAREAPHPGGIERRERVAAEEFFDRYYATNTPVLITGGCASWEAVRRWSPAYFKERLGDVEVQMTSGREGDPDYDMHTAQHSRPTRMGEFVDRVAAAGETNDFYLVANNRNLDRGPLQVLFDDVTLPAGILDPSRLAGCAALWFGPGGTVTPLHHDTSNILFAQIYGRKRVTLIAPTEISLLDGIRGVYAGVDCERPDLEKYPSFAGVARKQADLGPGDMLFLPVGWWHHVRALDVSISLAFTNFVRPNSFDWYRPGALR
jgi:Cupin-like domain